MFAPGFTACYGLVGMMFVGVRRKVDLKFKKMVDKSGTDELEGKIRTRNFGS